MSNGIPLRELQAAISAMELALNDDRAHRVTLPKDTYFALSRAAGVLEQRINSLSVVMPVDVEAREVAHG